MTGFLITFVIVMAIVFLLATTMDLLFEAWDILVTTVCRMGNYMKTYLPHSHDEGHGHKGLAIPRRRA